jgi:hypothetical protein
LFQDSARIRPCQQRPHLRAEDFWRFAAYHAANRIHQRDSRFARREWITGARAVLRRRTFDGRPDRIGIYRLAPHRVAPIALLNTGYLALPRRGRRRGKAQRAERVALAQSQGKRFTSLGHATKLSRQGYLRNWAW